MFRKKFSLYLLNSTLSCTFALEMPFLQVDYSTDTVCAIGFICCHSIVSSMTEILAFLHIYPLLQKGSSSRHVKHVLVHEESGIEIRLVALISCTASFRERLCCVLCRSRQQHLEHIITSYMYVQMYIEVFTGHWVF